MSEAVTKEAFYQAAMVGDLGTVMAYADAGGDLNVLGRNRSTAVMEACNDGNAGCRAILELLIARGADLNRASLYDQTALHWCIARGDLEALRLLVGAGADRELKCTARDGAKLTPLEMVHGRHLQFSWWRPENQGSAADNDQRCALMAEALE